MPRRYRNERMRRTIANQANAHARTAMGTKGRLNNGFCVYSGARAIMKIREQRRRIYTTG